MISGYDRHCRYLTIERAYGYFYALGDVVRVRMRDTRERFFVEMTTEEEAERAIQLYQDRVMWDGNLVVGPMQVTNVVAQVSDTVYDGPQQPVQPQP